MNVRQARSSDVDALAELIEASVRGLGPPHYDRDQIESSLEHLFGVDTTMIGDGTYFVAEVEGEMAGCGGWSPRKTPFGGDRAEAYREPELRDPESDPAILRAFFVHPEWTRRGIGTLLVEESERAALEAGFRSFELVSTLPGLPLYRTLGYRIVEPVPIALPDGAVIEAYRMVKDGPGDSGGTDRPAGEG